MTETTRPGEPRFYVIKTQTLPFRRGAIRHRRRYPRAYFSGYIVRCLALLSLSLIVIWPLTSPKFSLTTVVIETENRIPSEWVESNLRPFMGQNLPQLSFGEVKKVLLGHPWAQSVELHKNLPRVLRVHIFEKRPVALFREGLYIYCLDNQGVPIAPCDPDFEYEGIFTISRDQSSTTAPSAAIALIEELAATTPKWCQDIREIEILDWRDFILYSENIPFPIIVRSGTVDSQARLIDPLIPQLIDRLRPTFIDLRIPGRLIIRPSQDSRGR